MATIEEYTTGKVCEQLKLAFSMMDSAISPLKGSGAGDIMLTTVNKLAPRKITFSQAVELISKSRICAVGARVCLAVHTDAPPTKAVFLDKLAEGMAKAGKAKIASRSEAVKTLEKYSKKPLIVSRVSGNYAEICPTWPKRCLYWNMEKHKLKCIKRGMDECG